MSDLDIRVQQMVDAPAGCAFLLIATESGFTPEEAASPEVAVYVGAWALDMVEVWKGDHEEVIQEVLSRGQGQKDFARDLLSHPNASWWFAPVDRTHQVWMALHGEDALKEQIEEPGPPGTWDCYPQLPRTQFRTTTLYGSVASFLALCEERVCDYFSVRFPLRWWRLGANRSARVYEVDGPDAWHTLCTRYPWTCDPAHHPNQEGQLVPHWQAIAEDWDAVHLTFGGLLTSEQVRVESPAGFTWHWGWAAEQTLWLHWVFERTERLPDRERQRREDIRKPRLSMPRGAMLMEVEDPVAEAAARSRRLQELLDRLRRR